MSPFETYETFHAMKAHWTCPQYSFVKFRGKLKNLNQITYNNRKDKSFYEQVAKQHATKQEFALYLISCFLYDDELYIADVYYTSDDHLYPRYKKWFNKIRNLRNIFHEDVRFITKYMRNSGTSFEHVFLSEPIVDFVIDGKINQESFILLDRIINFISRNKNNNYLYNEFIKEKLFRYSEFVNVELAPYRNILESELKN